MANLKKTKINGKDVPTIEQVNTLQTNLTALQSKVNAMTAYTVVNVLPLSASEGTVVMLEEAV